MTPSPSRPTAGTTVRATVLVVALLALGVALAGVASGLLPQAMTAGGDPGAAVTGAAAAVGAALAAWCLLGVVLTLAASTPGSAGRLAATLRDRLTPLLLRRAAALAIGLAIPVGVGATAASASTGVVASSASPGVTADDTAHVTADETSGAGSAGGQPVRPGFTPTTPASPASPAEPDPTTGEEATKATPSPGPGWTPQRPSEPSRSEAGLLAGRGERGADRDQDVVVVRGDSLWSIASAALGPDATDAEIAAAWPRWFAHNREVIGPDPDLLLPGTRLQVPDLDAHPTHPSFSPTHPTPAEQTPSDGDPR